MGLGSVIYLYTFAWCGIVMSLMHTLTLTIYFKVAYIARFLSLAIKFACMETIEITQFPAMYILLIKVKYYYA